ncbi:Ubiquitin-conjugating enzyme, putative [Angomonas deanei]|uniref:Ubiquitin-conjugating enzyme, putative n=1 Tax=Angomonas deanei TaxID=59799 RepID=A0A7G2CRK8_9TRYP|nr:Ubiquitin-conjugating enzyme, putative [Angomonas deanei]
MSSASIKRLAREQRDFLVGNKRNCEVFASPLEENIFEWHFTILGPSTEPHYKDGIYHGVLQFQRDYPLSPPAVLFLTPNGRFEINTKICTTISSFHPELWRPSYSLQFVLQSLRLFMGQEEEVGVGAIHRTNVTKEKKKMFAEESWQYVCPVCGPIQHLYENEMKPFPPSSEELKDVPLKLPESDKKEVETENSENINNNEEEKEDVTQNSEPQETILQTEEPRQTDENEKEEELIPETENIPDIDDNNNNNLENENNDMEPKNETIEVPPVACLVFNTTYGGEIRVTVTQIDKAIKYCLYVLVGVMLLHVVT